MLGMFLAGIGAAADSDRSMTAADGRTLRLAVVNTPQYSGLLANLLPGFERQSGIEVEIYSGKDVYERARAGDADLVISHYGKEQLESFVLDGFGKWPRIVFANQAVLIGHRSDPANVRGLGSVAEAMSRIAAAKAVFVRNHSRAVDYLTEVMLESLGQPERTGWFMDSGQSNAAAVLQAEKSRGYVIWGAIPFLRFNRQRDESELEILVSADPALQRVMAAVVVNPEKVPGVNSSGAVALLEYLLSPPTQARIAAFRTPDSDLQLWWPAGRDN